MSSSVFIARLREGLRGLPDPAVAEIVADYQAHFADGVAEGRTEEEITRALGDPTRLARELRAESHLKRWEEERTASGAAGAVFAVIGLGAVDILILLPILLSVVSVLLGFIVAGVCVFFAGGFVLVVGPFTSFPAGPLAPVFGGLGMIAGSTGLLALCVLISIGLINLLVWYGRLHFRLLKPAIEPQNGARS